MSESERFSIAALIGVILRRKLGRTIDVQWLVKDSVYAREIINLCHEQKNDDLTNYANKLEILTFGDNKANATTTSVELNRGFSATRTTTEEELDEALDETKIDVSKYIGHLR